MSTLRHGHSSRIKCSPTYHAWRSMLRRCAPTSKDSRNYSARGIGVCDRWRVFESFLEDMGEKPKGRMSLDRIDNDKGYFPGNCRLATFSQQNRNTRRTRMVSVRGQSMSVADACELLGLPRKMVGERLRAGWSFEDACARAPRTFRRISQLTTPASGEGNG